MTTLYRPVMIESTEQAEKLPPGTLVVNMAPDDPYAWRKTEQGTFIDHKGPGYSELGADEIPGPDVHALVPVEAEEESQQAHGLSILRGATTWTPARCRLVTPWEPAP